MEVWSRDTTKIEEKRKLRRKEIRLALEYTGEYMTLRASP
jgi:hypothetical protein